MTTATQPSAARTRRDIPDGLPTGLGDGENVLEFDFCRGVENPGQGLDGWRLAREMLRRLIKKPFKNNDVHLVHKGVDSFFASRDLPLEWPSPELSKKQPG